MAGYTQTLRRVMTPHMAFIASAASIATFSQGYDNGWWGFLIGVTTFNQLFGSSVSGSTPTLNLIQLGLGTASTLLGTMVASPFAAYVAHRFGRIRGFYLFSALTIAGTLIEITCGVGGARFWQLVGGKAVVGLGIGFGSLVVPLYLSEVAPAEVRGATINFFAVNTWFGTFVSVAMAYAATYLQGHLVYIVPVAIQFLPPLLLLGMTFRMPESPRWLLDHGRREDAKRTFEFIHGKRSDVDWAELFAQFEDSYISLALRDHGSWRRLFVRDNIHRTMISVGVLCLWQGQGLSFVATYSNILLAKFTTHYLETFLAVVGALTILSSLAFVTLDWIGRRTLLLWGSVFSTIFMVGYGAIYCVQSEPSGVAAGFAIFFIIAWLITYTQTWSTAPITVYAEVPAEEVRAQTLAIGSMMAMLVQIIVVLCSPFIEAANDDTFQGKIGFIFGGVSVLSFCFTYLFIPELKGLTLEEADLLFRQPVPITRLGRMKPSTDDAMELNLAKI